jgi:glutamate racemase
VTVRSGLLGIFDSGVGGLTVVGALLRRFPHARVLYVADQAHVPYGGRPLEEVCGFACRISAFLAEQGCEAVVMACNISSATALPFVKETLSPRPVLGVIAPAVSRAAAHSDLPRIGVLATEGTVRSGAYSKQILLQNPRAFVLEVPCPKLVPLVEDGELETPEAFAAAREYLSPMAEARCDTILLGCTHYPFLLPTLRRAACDLFPYPVLFIDPADEMGEALRAALPSIETSRPELPNLLLTTGDACAFREQAPRFLPGIPFEVGSAHWTACGLKTGGARSACP